jgi:hypothetical protein
MGASLRDFICIRYLENLAMRPWLGVSIVVSFAAAKVMIFRKIVPSRAEPG